MYGLKHSGKAWYKCLSAAMNKIGFTRSRSDAAVFYRHRVKGFPIIAVAVDDLTITVINDDIIFDEDLQDEGSREATLASESQN